MMRLRLAVIGAGRLGAACAAAVRDAPDLTLAGIVQPAQGLPDDRHAAGGDAPEVEHVRDLGGVDAALVCVPTEAAAGVEQELLQMRIPIVECASFEGRAQGEHHERVAHLAARHRVGAVVGAGWDPGVLPQLRQLFEMLIPKGHTQQVRHLAAGLHHTACVEQVAGVHAALSSELPAAGGAMQRYVYVQLERGADFEQVRRQIEGDPLYADEPTQVLPVPDVEALESETGGFVIERIAAGGGGPHASLLLEARLDETRVCAHLMLDAARALARQPHQAWRYTPFGLVPLPGPQVAHDPPPRRTR